MSKNLKYVKIPRTLTVREYDIITPKGNKGRKPRVLKGGTVLLCVDEFLSVNPFRHGVYYKLLDEKTNYTYIISSENLRPITENTKVKEWYFSVFPLDDLGQYIKNNITFEDVYNNLTLGDALYDYVGIADSIVRERVFEQLSIIKGVDYSEIYNKWIGKK